MIAITIEELKNRPASQWFNSTDNGELIVMAQGEPVAVMLAVRGGSIEATLAALRSLRALEAQSAIQKEAAMNGTVNLLPDEIDAEIAAVRNSRKK